MKKCNRCGCEKPFDAFYKHTNMQDGYLSACKACKKKYSRSRSRTAEAKALRHAYDNTPERIAVRDEYNHSDKGKEATRKFNCSDKGKEAKRRYRKDNPEKTGARKKFNKAVLSGKITRPDDCSLCGVKCLPEGHHEDYSKPLVVVWLCHPCHCTTHNK